MQSVVPTASEVFTLNWSETMAKERKSNKEGKKKAALTPKEKKAAKRAKKDGTVSILKD